MFVEVLYFIHLLTSCRENAEVLALDEGARCRRALSQCGQEGTDEEAEAL